MDAQKKSLTADAATCRGLRLETHLYHDAQEIDYMAETHRVLGLESYHYHDDQNDGDGVDYMPVCE